MRHLYSSVGVSAFTSCFFLLMFCFLDEVFGTANTLLNSFRDLFRIQKSKDGRVNLPALEEELRQTDEKVMELERLRREADVSCRKLVEEIDSAAVQERKLT